MYSIFIYYILIGYELSGQIKDLDKSVHNHKNISPGIQ